MLQAHTQQHVTCTHNAHKKSGTSGSFKKFNVSGLLAAMLDDFICKKKKTARTSGVGKNEESESERKSTREKIREKKRSGKDVKGRRKLIAIYSMNHRVDKARTFKGRQRNEHKNGPPSKENRVSAMH